MYEVAHTGISHSGDKRGSCQIRFIYHFIGRVLPEMLQQNITLKLQEVSSLPCAAAPVPSPWGHCFYVAVLRKKAPQESPLDSLTQSQTWCSGPSTRWERFSFITAFIWSFQK